ncbi:MAG TPA: aquaporin [Candidatus Methylacidiphilales bacterium]
MKALLAEAIGTFALTFVGIGAISNQPLGGDLLMIALAYGLTVAVFASATAAISGGQLNPAITLGVWLAGKIRGPEALRYWIAQLTGAVLAGLAARYVFGDVAVMKGTPSLQVTWFQGFLLEALTTFFLVFVVFGTMLDPRAPRLGGLAVGLTAALGVLVAFPLTGGAMNPARAFGPFAVLGSWHVGAAVREHLVYWLGPLTGGAAGGILCGRCLIQPEDARQG